MNNVKAPMRICLDIVIKDKDGRIVETRHVERDIALRNFLSHVKMRAFNTAAIAADNLRDVLNNLFLGIEYTVTPYQMLGSGTTTETSSDYRIQTPLYTQPDLGSVGNVSLGSGNQCTLAVTSSHTFAAQTDVYEAGIVNAYGNSAVYLSARNYQLSRNTFAKVTVPAGGTFTGTYTFTIN